MLVFGDLLLDETGVFKFDEAELSILLCWKPWNLASLGERRESESEESDMSDAGRLK